MTTSPDPFEIPQSELAQQEGRNHTITDITDAIHPYDEGKHAAFDGIVKNKNPYPSGSQQRKRWSEGWSRGVSEKANAASSKALGEQQAGEEPAAEPPAPEQSNGGPKTHRIPKDGVVGVQPELIEGARIVGKAGDDVVELPEAIKEILQQTDDAIYNAALYKGQENEFRAQMVELMKEHHLNEVTLPRGGKLIYKPGKPSAQYVAPKDAKKPESNNGEGNGEA